MVMGVGGFRVTSFDGLRPEGILTRRCFGDRPLGVEETRFDNDGGLELNLGLLSRDPAGWRASLHTEVVEFSEEGAVPWAREYKNKINMREWALR